jgi:hypothetical protein
MVPVRGYAKECSARMWNLSAWLRDLRFRRSRNGKAVAPLVIAVAFTATYSGTHVEHRPRCIGERSATAHIADIKEPSQAVLDLENTARLVIEPHVSVEIEWRHSRRTRNHTTRILRGGRVRRPSAIQLLDDRVGTRTESLHGSDSAGIRSITASRSHGTHRVRARRAHGRD